MPTENQNAGESIAGLIARIERHESEAAYIEEATKDLGLDAKKIKAIRKAKADVDATKKTLEALMGSGLIADPAAVSE